MRPRELAHRVARKVNSELERIGSATGMTGCTRCGGVPFKKYLAGEPAQRFYRSHRDKLSPFVHRELSAMDRPGCGRGREALPSRDYPSRLWAGRTWLRD